MRYLDQVFLQDSVWIEALEALGLTVVSKRGSMMIRPLSEADDRDAPIVAIKYRAGRAGREVARSYKADTLRLTFVAVLADLSPEELADAAAVVGARIKALTDRGRQTGDVLFTLVRAQGS